METLLMIERDLTGTANTAGEVNPFNLLFIVLFAVFISWLALRLSGKGRRK